MKKFLRVLTVFLATLFVFTLASCNDESKEFAGTAQDLVNLINLKQDRQTVSSDFTVPGIVAQDGTTVEVLWTSDNTAALTFSKNEGEDPVTWKAEIHKSEKEEQIATFKASVTYKDVTATKNFKVKVARHIRPEENLENLYLGVYEDDYEATFRGWVAWMSDEATYKGDTQRNMFIYDESKLGFVYVYQMKIDPEFSKTVKIGDPVIVTGKVSTYGTRQLKHGSIVQDKKGTALEAIPETNITTDYIVNDSYTMAMHTAKLVTLQHVKTTNVAQEIKPARPDKKEPFNTTTILEGNLNGQLISVVANKDYITKETAEAALVNAKKVDGKNFAVTGFLSAFNGKPQIILIDPAKIVESTELEVNDSIKIASALNEAAELVSDEFVKPAKIALLPNGKTYANVALTYALEGTSPAFELVDGKLVVKTLEEASSAKLVITGTIGETKITKTVTLSVRPIQKVEFTGVVTMTSFEKGSVTIQAADGKATTLRPDKNVFPEDKWNATFAVGKELIVKGEEDDFSGLSQLKIHDAADVTVKGDKALPEAFDITELVKTSTNLSNDLLPHQSRLVVIKNATYKGEQLEVEGKTIKYYVDVKICSTAHKLVENGVYTITGIVNWFNSPQITPVAADAVVVISEPEVILGDATLKSVHTDKKATNLVEGNNAASLNLDPAKFEVTAAAGDKKDFNDPSKGLLPGLSSTEVRLYGADSKNGNSITVKALEGTISSIVVTIKAKSGTALATITGHEGEVTLTSVYQTIEIKFATPVSEFTIKNVTAASTQVHLSNVDIYFAK